MKKLMSIFAAIAVAASAVYFTGCTPLQKQAVAKQLGLAAAVTWIGVDNPSQEDIVAVKAVVEVIKEATCTNCVVGTPSFYTQIYPIADQYITEKLAPNQQPMARLGAAFILTSLDTAFAMNPSWSSNTLEVVAIANAFCDGAQNGLSLAPNDPVRMAVCRQYAVRASCKRN